MRPYKINVEELIETEAGWLRRFIRKGEAGIMCPEEVYFSQIRPGVVRGWYSNRVSVANLCVVEGEVRFLIKDKDDGVTYGPIALHSHENVRLTIEPGSWYAFKAYGKESAMICNALEYRYRVVDAVKANFTEDALIWSRQTVY